jgi:hypothetical protein
VSILCHACCVPSFANFVHLKDCCDCGDDDEFNLCILFHEKDPNCLSEKHELKIMQVAVPGDSYHPEETANGMKVIAGPKSLCCSSCDKIITQGWYYGKFASCRTMLLR